MSPRDIPNAIAAGSAAADPGEPSITDAGDGTARGERIAAGDDALPLIRIRPTGHDSWLGWRELWSERALLRFFVWRALQQRYRQAALGIVWAIAPPLITMGAFTILFGRVIRVRQLGLPYPVFYLSALVAWGYFSRATGDATGALVANHRLITRAYFPRVLLPLSAVIAQLVDFVLAALVLIPVLLLYGFGPTWRMLVVPLPVLLLIAAALAIGLWLAAFNTRFRDVSHATPALLRLLMLASPIIYPIRLVPAAWRWLYELNPVAVAIETFRWCVTGAGDPSWPACAIAVAVTGALLLSGLVHFQRVEGALADVV